MRQEDAAQCFAELGHATRLGVYRLLFQSGSKGLSVGAVQSELKVPGATLSHHIARLVKIRLIKQKRVGREMVCFAVPVRLDHLINYLQADVHTQNIVEMGSSTLNKFQLNKLAKACP